MRSFTLAYQLNPASLPTLARTNNIACLPVDRALLQRYLNVWITIGFLDAAKALAAGPADADRDVRKRPWRQWKPSM
ncbi:hypothetical protein [Paraburkholderia solisilvae]|uniref:hypothetical protein n=1 Tax=Paraburkholderia solisilvae TaxID=624376 RepID=UPI0015837B3C|nr:hypothetical protein [Paraburkholderia solisilvae]